MGNSGRFPQGKPAATESRYPNLINYKAHAGSFPVSGTNPLNSDMNYRIFNVRTQFFCVRINTGVGHTTDSESAQHF